MPESGLREIGVGGLAGSWGSDTGGVRLMD